MRRLHLFEFEDQPWFPSRLRDLLTATLEFGTLATDRYAPAAPLLADLLERTGHTDVIDLCSGAAGPWTRLAPILAERIPELTVTLTDRYPNAESVARFADDDRLVYASEQVDALAPPPELIGVRTMFSSLHHFKPAQARAIFARAVQDETPVAVFEFTERTLAKVLATPVLTPMRIAVATPRIEPLTPSRLLLTYAVPLIPVVTAWDGMVSHLRTYTPDELLAMAKTAGGFKWRAGRIAGNPDTITWLMGEPT